MNEYLDSLTLNLSDKSDDELRVADANGRSGGWTYASPAVMARVVNRALAVLERELRPAH